MERLQRNMTLKTISKTFLCDSVIVLYCYLIFTFAVCFPSILLFSKCA